MKWTSLYKNYLSHTHAPTAFQISKLVDILFINERWNYKIGSFCLPHLLQVSAFTVCSKKKTPAVISSFGDNNPIRPVLASLWPHLAVISALATPSQNTAHWGLEFQSKNFQSRKLNPCGSSGSPTLYSHGLKGLHKGQWPGLPNSHWYGSSISLLQVTASGEDDWQLWRIQKEQLPEGRVGMEMPWLSPECI